MMTLDWLDFFYGKIKFFSGGKGEAVDFFFFFFFYSFVAYDIIIYTIS